MPIPVTIITGFLGAGKTTFLNQIIAQAPSKRFAIIENELGSINIDSELVLNAKDDIFELSSGCICCALNGELVELLLRLTDESYNFDHLLIETTGIADPASVAAAFVADASLQQYFRLDAVIALADAQLLETQLVRDAEAARQISFADVIILNKIDLVSSDALAATKEILSNINPLAQVFCTEQSKLDTSEILALSAFDPARLEAQSGIIAQHRDQAFHHITAQSYIFDKPFDFIKLRHFIQVLLMFQDMRIYRMKGVLWVAGDSQKLLFQSVQKQTLYSKGSQWTTDEAPSSRLVVIGNGLNRVMFEKRLKECLAS